MVELEPHSVHGPVEAALGVVQRIAFRSQHGQVLDVAPRQYRAEITNLLSPHSREKKLWNSQSILCERVLVRSAKECVYSVEFARAGENFISLLCFKSEGENAGRLGRRCRSARVGGRAFSVQVCGGLE